jgi:hypothetical protein
MNRYRIKKGIAFCLILLLLHICFTPIIIAEIKNINELSVNNIFENYSHQNLHFRDPPDEDWNHTYGGNEYDYDIGYCVQQTMDDGYIIAGGSAPPGEFHYSLLIKTDNNGVEQWSKSYGEIPGFYAFSVDQTNDGGYILIGIIFENESNFADIFLCKTDLYGNEEWTKIINVSGEDTANCVKQTSDGGFILTGYSYIFEGYEPIDVYGWLIKTDSLGNIQWTKNCPSLSFSNYVKETTDGGFILTGGITDSFYSQNCDVLLIKTDINGNFIWEKIIGEDYYEYGLSVEQTSDQGYIIIGPSEDVGTHDSQIWLVKADADGVEMWNKKFGEADHDIGHCVDQTNDGGYMITGWTNSIENGNYAWLIKTDEQGILIWDKKFGPDGLFYSGEQTKEGGYIMVGQTEYYGHPKSNVWLVKVAPDYEYQPDLQCSGKFNWTGIEPGFTSTDSFNVKNVGGVSSLLDWKIESYPEWGTWTFTPSDYDDLKPEDGDLTVEISIKAPDEPLETFTGEIKIVSKHDSSDYCTISVSLTTPRVRTTYFNPTFLKLLEVFPKLCQFLKTFINLMV